MGIRIEQCQRFSKNTSELLHFASTIWSIDCAKYVLPILYSKMQKHKNTVTVVHRFSLPTDCSAALQQFIYTNTLKISS